ncbi:unnamed protein product [Nezara viridula]|uniref:Uncharacterized protein n=1 Tax=Nezara viridula TaxID=85310 RepID=A0A9P0HIG6_NEZVI|nr:unnamed protein product [Nezara viridula]
MHRLLRLVHTVSWKPEPVTGEPDCLPRQSQAGFSSPLAPEAMLIYHLEEDPRVSTDKGFLILHPLIIPLEEE